jgi:hypothetical protein
VCEREREREGEREREREREREKERDTHRDRDRNTAVCWHFCPPVLSFKQSVVMGAELFLEF